LYKICIRAEAALLAPNLRLTGKRGIGNTSPRAVGWGLMIAESFDKCAKRRKVRGDTIVTVDENF
jgi:hypothetical protein